MTCLIYAMSPDVAKPYEQINNTEKITYLFTCAVLRLLSATVGRRPPSSFTNQRAATRATWYHSMSPCEAWGQSEGHT